jgi:hypothetical protein
MGKQEETSATAEGLSLASADDGNDANLKASLCAPCGSIPDPDDWDIRVRARADKNGVCLCTVEELPSWHFQHRRIKHGYRYCSSYYSALLSFLYWHNESINTWSHVLAPIGIFWYFTTRWPEIVAHGGGSSFDQKLLAAVIILGNVVPLFCSAFCHNFYCVDKVR